MRIKLGRWYGWIGFVTLGAISLGAASPYVGVLPPPTADHVAASSSTNKAARSADHTFSDLARDSAAVGFEPNVGQSDAEVQYLAHRSDYTVLLKPSEIILAGNSHQRLSRLASVSPLDKGRKRTIRNAAIAASHVRMKFVGANPRSQMVGIEELPGRINYYAGKDANRWRMNVPTFAKVKYQEIYPGVDLLFRTTGHDLEFDFVVSPRADAKDITIEFEGADRISINESGDLVLQSGDYQIIERKPMVYQEENRTKRQISGRYILADGDPQHTSRSARPVRFELGAYDVNQSLIIDPVLVYSTFSGGSRDDYIIDIAVDAHGNAFVVGAASRPHASQDRLTLTELDGDDAYLGKISSDGSKLLYRTYFGGRGVDSAWSVGLDMIGNAYVTGATASKDFPVVSPFQQSLGGGEDAFVAKFDSTSGRLLYSTYLGGSDIEEGASISVEPLGSVYVTGVTTSSDFATRNPVQPTFGGGQSDAFIAKFTPGGSALIYSTYLGGSKSEAGRAIASDGSGHAYVTGFTQSRDFPIANAFQSTHGSGIFPEDAFVTKLSSTGSQLEYSTYLGGQCYDSAFGLAVDHFGNAYVTGTTGGCNLNTFPTLSAYQPQDNGRGDAFIAKLNSSGTGLLYATLLGGSGGDLGRDIAIDAFGNAYVTGLTGSPDFPLVDPLQFDIHGLGDAFVAKLSSSGTRLLFSTFLGGDGSEGEFWSAIAVDASGRIYIGGTTDAHDFPTFHPLQETYGGGLSDGFIVKIGP